MKTFTTTHTVYTFDELTDKAQQAALDSLYDVNMYEDWWEQVYEDAATIGLKITSFDTGRSQDITGNLTEDMQTVCRLIMENHGDTTNTYQLAVRSQFKHGEDNETTFLKELLEEYLVMLTNEQEYLTSEEAIRDAIKANEYYFYADGKIAPNE